MKHLIIISCLISITLNSCKKNIPQDRIEVLSLSQTETIIHKIASDDTAGRDTGSVGFKKAADYTIEYLKANKLMPLFDSFEDPFLVDSIATYNVVAINQEYDPFKKTILLTAHLDHLGDNSPETDKIYNGANDNASGVTAAMQIGAQLSQIDNIDDNIIVALFSAEERGLLGSRHLAAKMKDEDIMVDVVYNFEMIGVQLTDQPNTVYLTGFELSNMADRINEQADRELVVFLKEAKDFNLFRRSDNLPFYEAFQIPAQTFSSFDFSNYDYYHHRDDEVGELDIKNMNAIIKSLANAIESTLVNDIEIKLN